MSALGRRGRFVGLAAIVAVTLVVGWYLVVDELPPSDDFSTPALLTGVALIVIVPGLVGEWQRPKNSVSWLIVVTGIVTVDANFRLLEARWAATIGAAIFFAGPLVICHLLLALPDGLVRQVRKRAVTACWIVPAVLAAIAMGASGPTDTAPGLRAGGRRAASWAFNRRADNAPTKWWRQGNLLHVVHSDAIVIVVWVLWSLVVVTVAWTTVIVLYRRRSHLPAVEQRAARLARGCAVAVALAASTAPLAAYPEQVRVVAGVPIHSVFQEHWYTDLLTVLPALAAAALGGVLAWSELVRPRLGRGRDGAFELEADDSPSLLRDRLDRALGDPTARILYPVDGGGWLDDAGRPAIPAAGAGRAATIVTRHGAAVAAIEHDDSLLLQADLLDVAVASVALTLDGGRLAAVARASTDDIQRSAVRLLDSAERAREMVETRLRDGPERTLASVAVMLEAEPVRLEAVHDGLRDALAQVREIAHGLAPAGLEADGLRDALEQLAGASDVTLTIEPLPPSIPGAVEITVLLVVRDVLGSATPSTTVTVAMSSDDAVAADEVVVRVDGWAGSLDQVVHDRIETLGGAISEPLGGLVVALPVGSD